MNVAIHSPLQYNGVALITDQWLAGFVDGEGCFTTSGGYKHPIFCLTNTSIPVVHAIREYMQMGQLYAESAHRIKPTVEWRITKPEHLRVFIERMLPYLQVKKAEAEIVLEMIQLIERKKQGYTIRLTDGEWDARCELAAKLKACK